MAEKRVQRIDGAELRRLAEERLGDNRGIAAFPGSGDEPQRLLHELQVHQVELEMQNEELEEINLSLTQALGELSRKEQLLITQGRHAAMGEMINNIAHQWRQPLNTLGLLIQQAPLLYGTAEFSKEFLEENTRHAMQVIQHMSRTIDDFRNFFKSDKEVTAFSVNTVIMQTISLVEESFKAHRSR